MTIDDTIAGMCLYGFIRKETPSEQKRCLNEIEKHYGKPIATIVRNYMKKV